jgi:methyltransferase (TIGR00027 family)
MGRLLPQAVRIADDPYGVAFSSSRIARLVNRSQNHEGRAAMIARIPGLCTWIVYMQVRTRLIDDAVRTFVAAGGRQVVILGAGYDCRALRMTELDPARVYEIDHPATQGHKQEVLARLGVTSPVRYITWDFETRPMDELPVALVEAGHDPAALTLTVWEGVTVYLTEGAIDASLRAIETWSAPDSELAMTYLARTSKRPSLATRAVTAMVQRLGEPFKFGWAPEQLPEYLEVRGFQLERDTAIAEAARELMPPDLASQVLQAEDRVALVRCTAHLS